MSPFVAHRRTCNSSAREIEMQITKRHIARGISRLFSLLHGFFRSVGVVEGVVLLARLLWIRAERSGMVRRLRVPGSSHEVWLRTQTRDAHLYQQIFVDRQYDIDCTPQGQWVQNAYVRSVNRGERPLIVDCGANVGFASVYYALRFPGATIVSVEPDFGNMRMLRLNVSGLTNVFPVHAAVWDRRGRLDFVCDGADSSAFRVTEATGDGVVETVTLDEIREQFGDGTAFVVKMDVEGSESRLFRSTDWVNHTLLIALELHDWLLPGERSSHSFQRALGTKPREILSQGEIIFALDSDQL